MLLYSALLLTITWNYIYWPSSCSKPVDFHIAKLVILVDLVLNMDILQLYCTYCMIISKTLLDIMGKTFFLCVFTFSQSLLNCLYCLSLSCFDSLSHLSLSLISHTCHFHLHQAEIAWYHSCLFSTNTSLRELANKNSAHILLIPIYGQSLHQYPRALAGCRTGCQWFEVPLHKSVLTQRALTALSPCHRLGTASSGLQLSEDINELA